MVRWVLTDILIKDWELRDKVTALTMGLLSLLCCVKRREGSGSSGAVAYSHGRINTKEYCIDLD
jgi:hypothetical protein